MVQKYQNEIAPIFYYGKSPKTNEKDLKIPILWPLDWGQPYWMTLYIPNLNENEIFWISEKKWGGQRLGIKSYGSKKVFQRMANK